MKKFILAILFCSLLLSCSLEDGNKTFNLDIVPVSSVEMPTAYRVDSITKIPVTYIRPTLCHEFSNFYYNSIGNERTVAIYCSKPNDTECTPLGNNNNYSTTVTLSFKPKNTGTYNFRFWTGVDMNGTDQYIEHEVVVDH